MYIIRQASKGARKGSERAAAANSSGQARNLGPATGPRS